MTKLLLIDDSEDIGQLLEASLKPFFVHKARSVAEAEAAIKEMDYDLFLIDVALPDGNGFDFCLRLGQDPRHSKTPRILLTGKSETSEKVFGFNCGADDYVTKPFHVAELKARIDRWLKRAAPAMESVLQISDFSFDLEFQRCHRLSGAEKTDIALTPTEFRLFLTLAKNAGRVLSRKFLELVTWEAHGSMIEARGIDTHIAHIRKKLSDRKDCILSVYGQGYSFKAAAAERPGQPAA